MLKNILKLNGAQQLTKNEQKSINGGITQQCATAYANGCDKTILYSNCFPMYEGLWNSACKCCSY